MYTRALQRIEANGKGILLLHDIQARTVEALPDLPVYGSGGPLVRLWHKIAQPEQ